MALGLQDGTRNDIGTKAVLMLLWDRALSSAVTCQPTES